MPEARLLLYRRRIFRLFGCRNGMVAMDALQAAVPKLDAADGMPFTEVIFKFKVGKEIAVDRAGKMQVILKRSGKFMISGI